MRRYQRTRPIGRWCGVIGRVTRFPPRKGNVRRSLPALAGRTRRALTPLPHTRPCPATQPQTTACTRQGRRPPPRNIFPTTPARCMLGACASQRSFFWAPPLRLLALGMTGSFCGWRGRAGEGAGGGALGVGWGVGGAGGGQRGGGGAKAAAERGGRKGGRATCLLQLHPGLFRSVPCLSARQGVLGWGLGVREGARAMVRAMARERGGWVGRGLGVRIWVVGVELGGGRGGLLRPKATVRALGPGKGASGRSYLLCVPPWRRSHRPRPS
jgi:hypothetical protein